MPNQDPIDRKIRRASEEAFRPVQTDGQRQIHQRELMGLYLTKGMFLRPFNVNFDALPQEFDLTPPAALAKLFFFLALFFLFMTGLPFLIIVGQPDMEIWVMGLMAVGPAAALTVAIICWKKMRRRRWAYFEKTGVSIKQRGYPDAEEWRENYSTFKGLELEVRRIDTRYDKRDFFIIVLQHTEPARNVPLMIATNQQQAIDALIPYSERLKLPILEQE